MIEFIGSPSNGNYYFLIWPAAAIILMFLMKGRRIRYLMLNLSFLGYAALSVLSLGLGCIWTIPYYNVTCAEFYMELSGNYSGY